MKPSPLSALPAAPAHGHRRVRATVSVDPRVLDVYRQMSLAAGMSLSKCLGEWLSDTADGAQLIASKMLQAKRAPRMVMQELHGMLEGLHAGAGELLDEYRVQRVCEPPAAAKTTAAARVPPMSNTGGKSTKPKRRQ